MLGIPDALSANFHTVALDLPGFGESSKPVTMNYTIQNFRENIVDFINKLGINDGKTSIVGHSLGGYIAAEVTIENKNLVERLVLIDSSGMLKKTNVFVRGISPSCNESYKRQCKKSF